MAGIPSTAGAQRALRWVARALLRVTVLAGLVVCGWLLGAATGLADEDRPPGWPQDMAGPETGGLDAMAPEGSGLARLPDIPATPASEGPGSALLATVPLVETSTEELLPAPELIPATGVLRLPAPRPVPDLVVQVVQPVLTPVVEPVLHTIAPAPADQQTPSRTTVRAAPAVPPPAAPVAAPARAAQAAPLPLTDQAARAAPTPPSTAADLAASRFAGPSAAGGDSAPSIPASPLGTAPASCPTGPTGSNPTGPSSPGGTLTDGFTRTDLALLQHRVHTGAGGLPRCPSQQPSTSPD